EDRLQLVEIDRFEEVLVGAALHGLDGRLGRRVGGDEDDGEARVELTDAVEDVEAAHVGQADVEDDRVRHVGPYQVEALLAAGGRQDLERVGAQVLFQRIEHVGLVVDDQQAGHASSVNPGRAGTASATGDRGKETVNRAPPPGRLAAVIVPPCAST